MTSIVIIPVLNNLLSSIDAVNSALAQTVAPIVLAVDQNSGRDTREMLEGKCRMDTTGRLRVWRHAPAMPSLAATWNRALQYAWDAGAEDALVLNNDVVVVPEYYQWLRERLLKDGLLFLSGVGVTPDQYHQFVQDNARVGYDPLPQSFQLHPDFSAFLITKACHLVYPFDEGFTPAYCEDCDYHRRLLFADHGRLIGKINLPFLHHAAGTLKSAGADNARIAQAIQDGSRAHYLKKWGGPVNAERAVAPFGPPADFPVTNDALRAVAERGESVQQYLYKGATDAALRPADVQG